MVKQQDRTPWAHLVQPLLKAAKSHGACAGDAKQTKQEEPKVPPPPQPFFSSDNTRELMVAMGTHKPQPLTV